MNFPAQHELNSHSAMNENTSGPCPECGAYIEHVENCFCARPPQLFECCSHEDAEDSFYLVGCNRCGTYFYGHTAQFAFQHWNVNMAPAIVSKPAKEALAALDKSFFLKNSFCPFPTKAEAKASLETARRFTSYFGLTNRDAIECQCFYVPRWKRFLNTLFRAEDFDIFLWHSVIISILCVQHNGFSSVLTESLPISACSFFAFILLRAFVKFSRIKLDSISKQQSTTTKGENHG